MGVLEAGKHRRSVAPQLHEPTSKVLLAASTRISLWAIESFCARCMRRSWTFQMLIQSRVPNRILLKIFLQYLTACYSVFLIRLNTLLVRWQRSAKAALQESARKPDNWIRIITMTKWVLYEDVPCWAHFIVISFARWHISKLDNFSIFLSSYLIFNRFWLWFT